MVLIVDEVNIKVTPALLQDLSTLSTALGAAGLLSNGIASFKVGFPVPKLSR